MLTKDLIRARTYRGELKPQFIDTSNEELLSLASKFITLYDAEQNASRTEINEGVMGLVNSHRDIKLAKGLNKLILDRCEFSHAEENQREFRKELFGFTTELLKTPQSFVDFDKAVKSKFNQQSPHLVDVYSDHPECERLIQMKPITAEKLLERYNVSLVQSLLIQSNSVTVLLDEPDTEKLRRLFHYLKFFRLLAEIKYDPKIKNRLELTIAGPGKVLENISKYGMQLASFFPALINMNLWSITAEVKYSNKLHSLNLDQSSDLHSHYKNFLTYAPEEIKIFRKEFNKKAKEWKISDRTPFVKLSDGSLIFPDFYFRHSSGKVFALELFHRWHHTALLVRAAKTELLQKSNLIIGIDRSVAKKPHIAEELSLHDYFEHSSFLFNGFPAITVVIKLLDSLLK